MNDHFIPVNRPSVSEHDVLAVTRVLKDGWISGDSPEVEMFEQEFARQHGCSFGVAVPNGTVALDLLFSVLGIGPGDEVIMPTFSIISTVSQILRLGGVPVFIDADPHTWNMDVSQVEPLITERTKLIVVVHTYGLPANMDKLTEIATARGILLVEDCAEAHGLLYREKPCGSFGFASTFSFYANKNVTTGEGGMICTNSEELYSRLRYFRNLTFDTNNRFVHKELGWNYRFTAIQAAMGRSQLRTLSNSIDRRRRMAEIYRENLGSVEGITMAPSRVPYAMNDYWVVGIILDENVFGSARRVQQEIQNAQVATRPFFYPLHLQPVYKASGVFKRARLPVSEALYRQGFYPPNGLGSSYEEIDEAGRRIASVLGALSK